MTRTLIKDTAKLISQTVLVKGWVLTRRDHGKIVFINLVDRTGELQVVVELNKVSLPENIRHQSVLSISGKISARPEKLINPEMITGAIEMQAESVEVLAEAEVLPFELGDIEKVSAPIVFDLRPYSLRASKIKSIFKVQEGLIEGFRKSLKGQDFTEFQSTALVGQAPEGGSEVFKVDYYDRQAFLAQSPQLYKQMLVGVFERVFTVAKAYRAEKSVTSRHLSEYISLDAEFGFIDTWQDIMAVCEKTVKEMIEYTQANCASDLAIHNFQAIDTKVAIPVIKLREAQEILGVDFSEPDLNPEQERNICKWAKEKFNSDFVFITHFPTSKRPFYTFADPDNPEYTLSFDLLFRGLEIVTGGQRINKYQDLISNIKKWGNDPKNFEFYLQAFKFGMPPEGGFAIGTERITKQLLGIQNVNEASLFPRDMERIDQRFSQTESN